MLADSRGSLLDTVTLSWLISVSTSGLYLVLHLSNPPNQSFHLVCWILSKETNSSAVNGKVNLISNPSNSD